MAFSEYMNFNLIYSAKNNNKARETNQSVDLQTSNKMYILSSFGFSQYVHMLLLIMQFLISSQRLPQHEKKTKPQFIEREYDLSQRFPQHERPTAYPRDQNP